jgi:DNA-binding protein YbaB
MSAAFDLSSLFASPEGLIRQHEHRMARIAEAQRAIADAVGEAASPDERVRVRFSETDGVRDLTLDPRVLRLPAEDLARKIAETVNAARTACANEIAELSAATSAAGVPDPKAVLNQVPDVQRFLADLTKDTSRMTEQLESLVGQLTARAGVADDSDDTGGARRQPSAS